MNKNHGKWPDSDVRIEQYDKVLARFNETESYWATNSLSLGVLGKQFSIGERIIVSSLDSLTAAKQYHGESIVVLNMASHKRPGGGVLTGAPAQEEDLFRRTNLFQFLNPKHYPMNVGDGFLSKGISVCYGPESQGFAPYTSDECFCIDVMTIPAPVAENGETDHALMQKVIRLACQTSAAYDVAILSAFGCGAFRNDPEVVADIFEEELQLASARLTEFAILPLGERGKCNLEVFRSVFE